MILLLFSSVMIITLGIGILYIIFNDDGYTFLDAFLPTILCTVGGMLLGVLLIVIQQEKVPEALDVYRGNTTLEITYKDSIAIDSIVVFKNK